MTYTRHEKKTTNDGPVTPFSRVVCQLFANAAIRHSVLVGPHPRWQFHGSLTSDALSVLHHFHNQSHFYS